MSQATASIDRFPLQRVMCLHGEMAWREAGQGEPLVLLHGIGSGSASWSGQLDGLSSTRRVIAWDAPGYGGSAPLPGSRPLADDYAQVLDELLDRLDVQAPVILGHSLGAIVAAAWAARPGSVLRHLLLASPARGYGTASPQTQETKVRERTESVERLGVEAMAAARAAALCAPGAAADVVESVRANMARVTPRGYVQGAWMLAHADLSRHLSCIDAPVAVLCGDLDTVTPPGACEAVALGIGSPFTLLRGVGHACYLEDATQFNRALLACLEQSALTTQAERHA